MKSIPLIRRLGKGFIARTLGISRVLIHRNSSVLSAYGLALADAVQEAQAPFAGTYSPSVLNSVKDQFQRLLNKASAELASTGVDPSTFLAEYFLNLRYAGSDTTLMIAKPEDSWDFANEFGKRHSAEFGFSFPSKELFIENCRVRVVSPTVSDWDSDGINDQVEQIRLLDGSPPEPFSVTAACFTVQGNVSTPTHRLSDLAIGSRIQGPAIIVDATQTIVVETSCTAFITKRHVIVDVTPSDNTPNHGQQGAEKVDPIQLSIFSNRFMVSPYSEELAC